MAVVNLKCVVIGDGTVGKTAMIIRFCSSKFDASYIFTVFDSMSANIMMNGKTFNLTIWDTAGQDEYKNLRKISYPESDMVIICFALNSRVSYDNVFHKWKPEVNTYLHDVPIILVGTKSDLRNNNEINSITPQDGEILARKIEAVRYLECSSLEDVGVVEVFESVIYQKMYSQTKKTKRICTII